MGPIKDGELLTSWATVRFSTSRSKPVLMWPPAAVPALFITPSTRHVTSLRENAGIGSRWAAGLFVCCMGQSPPVFYRKRGFSAVHIVSNTNYEAPSTGYLLSLRTKYPPQCVRFSPGVSDQISYPNFTICSLHQTGLTWRQCDEGCQHVWGMWDASGRFQIQTKTLAGQPEEKRGLSLVWR
jgi:hypothetical protein